LYSTFTWSINAVQLLIDLWQLFMLIWHSRQFLQYQKIKKKFISNFVFLMKFFVEVLKNDQICEKQWILHINASHAHISTHIYHANTQIRFWSKTQQISFVKHRIHQTCDIFLFPKLKLLLREKWDYKRKSFIEGTEGHTFINLRKVNNSITCVLQRIISGTISKGTK